MFGLRITLRVKLGPIVILCKKRKSKIFGPKKTEIGSELESEIKSARFRSE